MRGEESSEKTPTQSLYSSKEKNLDHSTRFHLSLYSAQISKNTKIPSIPIIHEGQNGKNHKKKVKQEVNKAKKTRKCRGIFAQCENFALVRNFAQCENFVGVKISHSSVKLSIFQLFLLFFPSGF